MSAKHFMRRLSGGRSLELVLANLAYALSQLVLLLILARTTDVVEVGRFAFALALTGPIHLAMGMRLRSMRVVDRAATSLKVYVQLALLSGGLAFTISTMAAALVLQNSEGLAVACAVSVSKIVEGVVDVVYGDLQREGQIRKLAILQVARASFGILAFSLGVLVSGSALGGALGLVVAWALPLVFVVPISETTRAGEVASLARRSWPLGAAAGLNSLNSNGSRLAAEGAISTSATGVLAIVSYPGMIISILANSMGQALLGGLRRAREAEDRERAFRFILPLVGVPLMFGMLFIPASLLWGDVALGLVFGWEYASFSTELAIMAAAATLGAMSTVFYYDLLALGAIRVQGKVALATSLIGVPLMVAITVAGGSVTFAAWGALALSSVQLVNYSVARLFFKPRCSSSGGPYE